MDYIKIGLGILSILSVGILGSLALELAYSYGMTAFCLTAIALYPAIYLLVPGIYFSLLYVCLPAEYVLDWFDRPDWENDFQE